MVNGLCREELAEAAKRRPSDGEFADESAYRKHVFDVLRQNTPAHIAIDLRFVSPCQMIKFEDLHGWWCDTLRKGHPREINLASNHLIQFFRQCEDDHHGAEFV